MVAIGREQEHSTTSQSRHRPWLLGQVVVLGLVALVFVVYPDPIVSFATTVLPSVGSTLAWLFIGAFALVWLAFAAVYVALRVRFRESRLVE